MGLEAAPKKLLGTLGGVVVAAPPRRQEAQPQSFATFSFVQIASQGIPDQGCNRKLFSLGQEPQLTLRAFFKKKSRSLHIAYDTIQEDAGSIGAACARLLSCRAACPGRRAALSGVLRGPLAPQPR